MQISKLHYVQEQIAEFSKAGGYSIDSINSFKEIQQTFLELRMENIPLGHRANLSRVKTKLDADKTSSMGEPKFTELKNLFATIETALQAIIDEGEPSAKDPIGFKIN